MMKKSKLTKLMKHHRNMGVFILMLSSAFISCVQKTSTNEDKIDQLISRMTLEEKIGQMNQLTGTGLSTEMKEKIRDGKVGSIINETNLETINELQKIAVKESRLGIPLLIGRDVIHGFKTIFPIPLGQAATWNEKLVEDGASIAAREATSIGIRWTFAPMIDVTRDPRWGRIAESCGEDPFLTSKMGVAMIKGFQGHKLSDVTSMAACAKHFAAYGATESGKDYNTTWIPEVLLRDVYLPSFQTASEIGVATFMCSFNDINGVPSSGNEFLLRKVLRDEWKYKGSVVSDWGSIEQMVQHGVCSDKKDAAKSSLTAGVDIDMMSNAYIEELSGLIKSGVISEKLINEAVKNILRLKFNLGLFDQPFTKVTPKSAFYSDDALQKAKQSATESVVLLKNSGNILPLSNKIKTVAVVGPLSDAPADQLGTWCFDAEPSHSITVKSAIENEYGKQLKVISEKGLTYSRDEDPNGIIKAVKASKNADVILCFVGEEAILSGEAHCRADLNLPGIQSQLIAELRKTGKPLVLIVMAGRPLTIEKELNLSDAVLYAFHGGTMAGPALADLIFGKAVPSGKLPVTFPRMVGQIPVYYAHKMTGRPAKNIVMIHQIPVGADQTSLGNTSYYLDAGDKPLFPFGFGLSYTTFNYSNLRLSKSIISKDEKLKVECNISNTGKFDADEIAQLYVRDLVASLARPVRELKGFKKIRIKSGETITVQFELDSKQLAFWNSNLVKTAEPGDFQVWISSNSETGNPLIFTLK